MRLIFFALCLIGLSSCQFTQQQKIEHIVNQYLDSTLNDPHSYESVKFSKVYRMKDTVFNFDGKPDSVHYHGDLMIQHTYRAKNAMGGVTTKTDWFKIDSAMKKVSGDWDAPKSVY